MQIKDARPLSFTKQIRCDRCERLADLGDMEFEEFVSIDRMAGYTSIFGDGHQVQLDLCQHCLKDVLGRWLRINDASAKSLSLFDPNRHGGEFPTAADASLQKPADMPVHERIEKERRRLQAEFVQRGQEAIKRSEATGDWTPADAVIEELRVKVAAAHARRSRD